MSYKDSMSLDHNEKLVAIDVETGEIREKRKNNIPDDKEVFNEPFIKLSRKGSEFLDINLTDRELRVIHRIILKSEFGTNSLKPLSDRTSNTILAEELGVHRTKITPMFNKFYDLGLYSSSSVMDYTGVEKTYWVLNPYLAFSGRLISKSLKRLFIGTKLAIYCTS